MKSYIFFLPIIFNSFLAVNSTTRIISSAEFIGNQLQKLFTLNFDLHKSVLRYRPQSLAILMNFDNEGKVSLLFLNSESVFWSDTGYCNHGQMYDPAIGLCRDIFCLEGYYLTPTGCQLDSNNTHLTNINKLVEIPDEIDVEFTLNYGFTDDINETYNFSTLLNENTMFLPELQQRLTKALNIDFDRIKNIKVVRQRFEMNSFVDYDDETVKFQHLELLDFSIRLRNKTHLNDTTETMQIFYNLYSFALHQKILWVNNCSRSTVLSNVMQIKSQNSIGWCEGEL